MMLRRAGHRELEPDQRAQDDLGAGKQTHDEDLADQGVESPVVGATHYSTPPPPTPPLSHPHHNHPRHCHYDSTHQASPHIPQHLLLRFSSIPILIIIAVAITIHKGCVWNII